MDHRKRDFLIAFFTLIIIASSSYFFSKLQGATKGHLSIINILLPASAAVSQFLGGTIFAGYFILRLFSQKFLSTCGIPTLAACIAAGSKNSRVLNIFIMIILPLSMMAAFTLHTVGSIAWAYSLFWLIPVAYGVFSQSGFQSLFFHMIATTFVAHAVGSVIWIYTHHTTPQLWIGLIPLVIVERCVFASGITLTTLLFKALHFNTLHDRFRLLMRKLSI